MKLPSKVKEKGKDKCDEKSQQLNSSVCKKEVSFIGIKKVFAIIFFSISFSFSMDPIQNFPADSINRVTRYFFEKIKDQHFFYQNVHFLSKFFESMFSFFWFGV